MEHTYKGKLGYKMKKSFDYENTDNTGLVFWLFIVAVVSVVVCILVS